MPTASAAGVADAQLDRVLRARPDLAEPVCDALAHEGAPPDTSLRLLRFVVAAAYYLSPEVRAAMQYDPERVSSVSPFEFPEYAEEGLLDHMLDATG
jgi:hypothetical protein